MNIVAHPLILPIPVIRIPSIGTNRTMEIKERQFAETGVLTSIWRISPFWRLVAEDYLQWGGNSPHFYNSIMKKIYSDRILSFFVWWICTFCLLYFLQCHTDRESAQLSFLDSEHQLCTTYDASCRAKINQRTSFLNDISAQSFFLEKLSWGSTWVIVNFPAFSDRTPDEKKEIYHKIHESGAQRIILGFASSRFYPEDLDDIPTLLSVNSFDDIHIRLYSEPLNLIELFDAIDWEASKNMKLSIELINVDLPLDINLYEYFFLTEQMIQKNNGMIPLESLTFWFDPLFYAFGNIDSYIVEPNKYRILQHFPTLKLSIQWIWNTFLRSAYSNDLVWGRWKIQYFFDTSPIENIFIENVGQKVNWVTHLL